MTPIQLQELNDFFENTRLMRLHQIRYKESRYSSEQDDRKAKYYQGKVDQYIRQQIKLQRTKQAEIF
jgi:hypothetical protein